MTLPVDLKLGIIVYICWLYNGSRTYISADQNSLIVNGVDLKLDQNVIKMPMQVLSIETTVSKKRLCQK